MGKKSKQDDESEDIDEGTNPSHQSDATGSTDVSEDEDEGTEAENNSLVYKLKKKIQSLQKGKSKAKADDDDEEASADEDSEAAKKKKKSRILQFVIVGGTALFLLSDYIIPTEEPAPVVKLKPKGKKVKPAADIPAEEKPATDPGTETPATAETPATDPATVTPSESPVDVTETPADTTTTPVETAPTDTTITDTPVETIPTDTTVTETPEDTTTTPVETAPVDTTITDTPIETTPTDTTVTETPAEDTGMGEAKTPGEDNLTDQILEDLEKQAKDTQVPEQKKEYVAPPDYEYRGRGLVYNCSGKHWACVDAPSYKTCEDNQSSVKYLNKKTECHPFNVYETPKGCEGVQNRMVSSSAKTEFCND